MSIIIIHSANSRRVFPVYAVVERIMQEKKNRRNLSKSV